MADQPIPGADEGAQPAADVVVEGINLTRDFVCHCCGNCCRGPGTVWIARAEEVRIAEHLGLPLSEFRRTYCAYEWRGGHVLRDRSEDDDACVFLDAENRCRIHAVKPTQCLGFPYAWRTPDFTKTCEGMLVLLARQREVAPSDT